MLVMSIYKSYVHQMLRQAKKVVVAKVGTVMPSGMVIKDAELRGVASSGMICSMKELNYQTHLKKRYNGIK